MDRLEIGDVVVSEVLTLLRGYRIAQFLITVDRAMQKNYGKIFVVSLDIQFLRILNQPLLVEFNQGYPKLTEILHKLLV